MITPIAVKCTQLLDVLATAKGNDEATKDCLNGLNNLVTERVSHTFLLFGACIPYSVITAERRASFVEKGGVQSLLAAIRTNRRQGEVTTSALRLLQTLKLTGTRTHVASNLN